MKSAQNLFFSSLLGILGVLLIPVRVFAEEIVYSTLEETVSSYSVKAVLVGGITLVILAIISLTVKNLSESSKKVLFILISTIAVIVTIFLAASTIYINAISHSGGPVHYHADFEIYACGKKLDLLDPTGISNKIGTATLHEHNDFRIHLEGVVVVPEDQTLGKFFHVIGGKITPNSITLPTTTGVRTFTNGDLCPNGEVGTLNVFVYRTVRGEYIQQKILDPARYIYTGESQVPPGDCIIIEFGEEKESTEKICLSYQVAEEIGKVKKAGE